MSLKIVCSGHLIRYPVGGFTWHHLQYLVGLRRLGHEVIYFEHHGWPNSCYDPDRDIMTADPAYGLAYFRELMTCLGLEIGWTYLAEDGVAHGLTRQELAEACGRCDVYLNLSNINWIPELEACRRRVLVDTDPVFTQIGAHGMGGAFSRYQLRFTYGENVHHADSEMPTGGTVWLPTRQPVVLDLWEPRPVSSHAPFTSVMNWSAYGEHEHEGRSYGQKDREFAPFFVLPRAVREPMELAINAPVRVRHQLQYGGWRLADPRQVTRTPGSFQDYIAASRAEFSVAKHGYVSTQCGWFSDRSCGYLASGRPVILQDTGFSRFLPCGEGLLAFRTPDEAADAIHRVSANIERHGRAARAIAETHFDARRVLTSMLEECLGLTGSR